jgi:hypothetical protein
MAESREKEMHVSSWHRPKPEKRETARERDASSFAEQEAQNEKYVRFYL